MDTRLIDVCLQLFDRAGISADEQLLKLSSEETLRFNSKLLTLLLDGQEPGQKGRFASVGVDSNFNVLSFVVFERLKDSTVKLLASAS